MENHCENRKIVKPREYPENRENIGKPLHLATLMVFVFVIPKICITAIEKTSKTYKLSNARDEH